MYKIAAMGDRDSIYGFASLGLSVFPEDDPQSASHKLKKLAEEGYAVIFITEALAELISPEIERFKDSPLPAIIPHSRSRRQYGTRNERGKRICRASRRFRHR